MPSPSRYVVPTKLADITPRKFLRLQRRLFATVTPEWRDAVIAAREAAPKPEPLAPFQPVNHGFFSRPQSRLKQVMEVAATLAKPGEPLPLHRIAEASGIPKCTVYAVTRPARADGSWPYTGSQQRSRRKSRVGTIPPSR
jgi:hypothetical protein